MDDSSKLRAVSLEYAPPGWECRVAPNGHAYYIDRVTHTTTWEKPSLKRFSSKILNGVYIYINFV